MYCGIIITERICSLLAMHLNIWHQSHSSKGRQPTRHHITPDQPTPPPAFPPFPSPSFPIILHFISFSSLSFFCYISFLPNTFQSLISIPPIIPSLLNHPTSPYPFPYRPTFSHSLHPTSIYYLPQIEPSSVRFVGEIGRAHV